MIQKAAVLAAVLLTPSLLAEWGSPCDTNLTVQEQFAKITAIARCSYLMNGVQNNSVQISIRLEITPGNAVDACSGQGYCGTHTEVFPYTASTTYTATAEVKATQMFEFDSRTLTDSKRTPDPQRPHCTDSNSNGICDDNEAQNSDPNQCGDPCTSPILINPHRGAYTLSGVDDPVRFDIDGDGAADSITWTARGSGIAFLALDRNGNQLIDDGAELFGTATPLVSGARAGNGFEALKEFDSNGDGRVSGLDDRWRDLLLWTDVNHDGISQGAELRGIAGSEVQALDTKYHWTGRRDPSGNLFRYEALAHIAGTRRPIYDVFFRIVR